MSSSSSLTEAWHDGTREEAEVGGDDALDVFTDDPLELSALAYALRDVLDVTVFNSDVFGVFLAWVFAGAFFVGALLEGVITRGCLSIHPPFFFQLMCTRGYSEVTARSQAVLYLYDFFPLGN